MPSSNAAEDRAVPLFVLPVVTPTTMPAAIITRATVVGIGRTVHSSISVTVVRRGISAVVGRRVSTVVSGGVAVIIAWRIAVAIARSVSVGVRRKAADKGTGN